MLAYSESSDCCLQFEGKSVVIQRMGDSYVPLARFDHFGQAVSYVVDLLFSGRCSVRTFAIASSICPMPDKLLLILNGSVESQSVRVDLRGERRSCMWHVGFFRRVLSDRPLMSYAEFSETFDCDVFECF